MRLLARQRPPASVGRTRIAALAVGSGATILGLIALRAILPGDAPWLSAAASDLVTLALAVFVESLPFVILGTLLSIAVQVWLPAGVLERVLPRRPGPRRMVLSLCGVVLPVCECGNVPLARGLIQRGFAPAEAITFLLAAPILNPVTILTTAHAFGWDSWILIARIGGGFVIANLLGWWLSAHPQPSDLLAPGFRAACEHAHAPSGSRISRSADSFLTELSQLMPALALGSLLAGAIQVGVPRSALIALGAHPLWSVLALIALAFVISLCSNVDAFFILSLSAAFLPGSIVAFLLFGAMMDVKMVALMRTTFTGRTIALLAGVIAACAAAIGWGMNLVA